jgi:hypothetical protein
MHFAQNPRIASSRSTVGPAETTPQYLTYQNQRLHFLDSYCRRGRRPSVAWGFVGIFMLSAAAFAHHVGKHQVHLILTSSSVFCARRTWLACARTNCLRVRSKLPISWVCPIPHKTRPDQTVRQQFGQPHGIVHVGLAAREFFTCAAFASPHSNSPSSKVCHTGVQQMLVAWPHACNR